ncbi:MAG TPA: glycosyltransferase [Bacteroidales bacterium]|nr:glycosyltransferase [Bacteroidales bacterium]
MQDPYFKNLLFICANYPKPGGVETVTGMLVDFFLSKGSIVYLMVSKDPDNPIPPDHRHFNNIIEMPDPQNSLQNLSFIEHFIRTHSITCVFNQGVFSQIYTKSSNHPNTLFINTLHSMPFWEIDKFVNSKCSDVLRPQKGVVNKAKILLRYALGYLHPEFSHPNIRRFYRHQIECADWFVVLDKSFKTTLENKLYHGLPHPKIQVIPNPLKSRAIVPFNKQKQVLYVGRLTAEPKRVDRLLRIWSLIESQVPDWNLQIVGDGDQRGYLEQLGKDLKLKNVVFRGFQDPTTFYASASILCLTSTYEGAPMVISEAQSYGTVPIVFGSVDSIYSLIDNNLNGIIVPPFDEKAFANDLLKLIQDEANLKRLSEGALKKVKDLDVENIGRQWLKLHQHTR